MALDDEAWDEALHYAKQALYVDVMDPQVHVLLGKAWSGLGKQDKAVEEWTVAVELKPSEADYGVGLARAEAAAGQKEAAAKRVAEILKKHPTHAEAQALADELK
jgi:tetratricopeptide (TPR) repeat protein